MRKKIWMLTILVFLFGILVGGGIQNWRENSVDKIFAYNSSSPMLLTITEKEINQKNELIELFRKYGQADTDAPGEQMIPKEQKELLSLLPEGSVVEYCIQFQGEIEIRYELNDFIYHVDYTKTNVTKAVEFEYNKKQYYIINTNNKEFECHKMK